MRYPRKLQPYQIIHLRQMKREGFTIIWAYPILPIERTAGECEKVFDTMSPRYLVWLHKRFCMTAEIMNEWLDAIEDYLRRKAENDQLNK